MACSRHGRPAGRASSIFRAASSRTQPRAHAPAGGASWRVHGRTRGVKHRLGTWVDFNFQSPTSNLQTTPNGQPPTPNAKENSQEAGGLLGSWSLEVGS